MPVREVGGAMPHSGSPPAGPGLIGRSDAKGLAADAPDPTGAGAKRSMPEGEWPQIEGSGGKPKSHKRKHRKPKQREPRQAGKEARGT